MAQPIPRLVCGEPSSWSVPPSHSTISQVRPFTHACRPVLLSLQYGDYCDRHSLKPTSPRLSLPTYTVDVVAAGVPACLEIAAACIAELGNKIRDKHPPIFDLILRTPYETTSGNRSAIVSTVQHRPHTRVPLDPYRQRGLISPTT